MRRAVSFVLLLGAVGLLGLPGCSNQYSDRIQYGVRTDPMVLKKELTLRATWFDPDVPGQLPLLSLKELKDPWNPLHNPEDPTGERLIKEEKLRDPNAIPAEQREMLNNALATLFGKPAEPKVQLDDSVVSALKIQMPTLKDGANNYRIHCLHCHGVSGDGRGPTARWVNPHPRDFRQGLFKFQTVSQKAKSNRPPRREDLYRTIHDGLDGTVMPAHLILKEEEIQSMVSYVIHLAIRGRTEFDTLKAFQYTDGLLVHPGTPTDAEGKPLTNLSDSQKDALQQAILADVLIYARGTAGEWVASQRPDEAIKPAANPYASSEKEKFASMLRGKLMFLGKGGADKRKFRDADGKEEEISVKVDPKRAKEANCVECHVDFGRRAEFRWDEWGTEVRPRNFTEGIFRGGKRPIDVFSRVHSGINGSGMQSYHGLGDETLWDLVNFVQALGYPKMREKLGID
ncbi:MAG: cytochrome c [Gemmataceae bacterium]